MANDPSETGFNDPPLTTCMPRPRLDIVFDRAARGKLIYVIAGAGYGKTQAVRQYVGQQDAVVRWVQLTESDNIGSRYWESFTHSIAHDNHEMADKLRELGFPETPARFKQFAGIIRNTEHRTRKVFLVLDDFHLIHSELALSFAERCAHLHIPGACVILISRNEPGINAMSLFSGGKASIITEDELRFTIDEIAAFFKLRGIKVPLKDLQGFLDATKGWALAINLLSMVLAKAPRSPDLAIDTMKHNIFRLFETEAFSGFPEDAQKTMIKLSLVSDLPLTPLHGAVIGDPFIQYIPQLASFVWYDNFTGDYRVHPLFMEFLQNKHHLLSDEEKQETYRKAAQWCLENGYYTDAINYCAKSRQFERMVMVLFSYPFKLPYDVCEYVLNVIEGIDPDGEFGDDYSVLFLKNFFIPILLMGMGRYEEARERSFNTIREWEPLKTPFSYHILSSAYSNLTYIDTYTCTVTHVYDAPEYLKKSLEYRELSGMPPVMIGGAFAAVDIRSFACLIGEGAELQEFDRFIDSAREITADIAKTQHKMYYGYDDLAACEIAFFKNRIEPARNHAHSAILKAREKNQYGIEMMAQFYLLRIAIHDGDYALVKETIKQMDSHLDNKDFWNRNMLYDLFTGTFFLHIGLHDMAPSWLTLDERDTTSEVHIPTRELIVGARYYITRRQYKQALAVICNSYPRDPQERFFFGELVLSLLLATSRLMTGDAAGAAEDFEKAYVMSFSGVFEMPFIELGKTFQPMADAVLTHGGGAVPEEWLRTVGRKASAYAKRTAAVVNPLKRERNIEDGIKLSEREREVLSDLRYGLSREEIAENRYLSIHTVKSILRSIYIKLDAKNNVDAVLTALDKKLID